MGRSGRGNVRAIAARQAPPAATGLYFDVRTCVGCGCTDDRACVDEHGPCSWAIVYDDEHGLCSRCQRIVAATLKFVTTAGVSAKNAVRTLVQDAQRSTPARRVRKGGASAGRPRR